MDASLLDKEQSQPKGSRSRKRLALGICVLTGLGCSGTLLRHHFPGLGGGTKQMKQTKPVQIDTDYDYGGPECIKFTGGTCNFEGCNEERHSTCKGSFGWHYCACDSDEGQGCVGGDGNCRSEVTVYEKLASHIRLKNVMYDDMYLYSPDSWYENQLRVDSKGNQEGDRWTIYRVPGKIYNSNNTQTAYMVRNDKFPTYAAGVRPNKILEKAGSIPGVGQEIKFGVQVGASMILSPLEVRVMNVQEERVDPTQLIQWICKNDDGSIRINGLNPDGTIVNWLNGMTQNSASWFVHGGSWEVFGYYGFDGNVGQGGDWNPEPPLDQDAMDKLEHCLKPSA